MVAENVKLQLPHVWVVRCALSFSAMEREREESSCMDGERKMTWKWQGKEGGLDWRCSEREEMAAEGRGERWISVDLRRNGTPKRKETRTETVRKRRLVPGFLVRWIDSVLMPASVPVPEFSSAISRD